MKKLLCTTLAVGILTSMSFTPAFADVAVNTLPGFNSGTNVDVTTSGTTMNVQINAGKGGVGVANWDTFNVGKDATVNFEFTNHNQTSLNKVSATGGISQIYGKITESSCLDCGYNATGKVLLINPNGVLFGDGANVNLNSFTVSTYNANYDADSKTLELVKDADTSDFGIKVHGSANIHGEKGVTFASNNIAVYEGSKISTGIAGNYVNAEGVLEARGKVKLVTADGVNFTYFEDGTVKALSNVLASDDVMKININGEITSGHIDIRNASSFVGKELDSEININGGVLKAVKAEKGNDGNIWLTSSNKIILDNGAKLETVNGSAEAANRTTGEVYMKANGKISIALSEINSVGNVELDTTVDPALNLLDKVRDIGIEQSTINAVGDVSISANNVAALEDKSTINAKNINLVGLDRAQIIQESEVNAEGDVNIGSKNLVWLANSLVNAKNSVNAVAISQPYENAVPIDGSILLESVKIDAPTISLDAAFDVVGVADVSGKQTNIYAGRDIDVALLNVGNAANGLIAEAGNNLTVQTDGTLAVARLVAKNGNLTLKADKVIKGLPYTEEQKLDDDLVSDRGYIEVRNGTFASITANDSYKVTASGEPVDNGVNNMRHHIEYGNGAEKILLVTKMPAPAAPVEPDVPSISVNDDQASMLNRLPQQPQSISPNNNITDGRTSFIDVFAAASQIEIDDEEE